MSSDNSLLKAMPWSRLHDRKSSEFYTALNAQGEPSGGDWQPMVEVIRDIKSMNGAVRLFAFISQQHLYLTTASRYVDSSGHYAISIAWEPRQQSFRIGYSSLDHDLGAQPEEQARASPESVREVLAPLLARLLTAA